MTEIDRFWSRVDVRGEDECWPWVGGATVSSGYGTLGWSGTTTTAHRVAYEIANGPVPNGMVVRHRCDNPACVNPSHLVAGTQWQNIRDAMAKGRHATGDKHGRRKLTSSQVAEMRALRTAGATLSVIASHFGVVESTVSVNVRGIRWKDAGGPLVATSSRGQR